MESPIPTNSPESNEDLPAQEVDKLIDFNPEVVDKEASEKVVETAPPPNFGVANQTISAPVVLPQTPQTTVSTDDDSTKVQDDDLPESADDIDLIEKQWVKKAKDVVEQTKDDPHQQNTQLNSVKTGYKKKRFNFDATTPDVGS